MIFSPDHVDQLKRMSARGESILVSTHINPDPDAIGSALAAREILTRMGANVTVVVEKGFAPRLNSLPHAREIQSLTDMPAGSRFETAFIVDCGNLERIGDVANLLSQGATLFNVDHHVSNDNFGGVNWVDIECSAACELLFLLAKELELEISASLATNLYAGILTDTGRFRFSSTTPRTLLIAADLVALGANPTQITNALYYDLPAKDLLSMSRIYGSLMLHGDGLVSSIEAQRDSLVEDPDSIVDLALSIRGVEIAALMSETDGEKIRISLRSKSRVNVSKIAESLGGGGHERAAGFRMNGPLDHVRDIVIPILVEAAQSRESMLATASV